uniref:SGNH hydrolase-type esterase domain-containing protein n=1 Tax=Aureoumbra lagunensis TaxID=44058 RepID=A0A7S3K0S6_9STRA|eukprot:CAMPEP_0197308746 /NCGR_PEP_ID=MMETSP0891-20130614/7234_1 /TAXON_ID=44058 ORGANISM="Aureoumbra lagunensis, Strain CCMP1510" /NCGR_SAMPLE_ID=MMETSP0891 /ASSEMBLY_ACC=CAM_ASM_000534 /LENGTH=502 /DNA_ID=CAMNT_0042793405 /DNA_START=124 /DNA_END=1632 /DNA_ORIENTATION=-
MGDSITSSSTASSPELAWPAQLDVLLGDAVTVRNFGRSGRTVMLTEDAYTATNFYNSAIKSGAKIGILLLGTNDAKEEFWDTVEGLEERFRSDFETLVTEVSIIFEIVIAATPVPQLEAGGYWGDNLSVLNEIIPNIIKQVCLDFGIPIVAVNEIFYTENVNGTMILNESLFFDNVHPNDKGYTLIAEKFYDEVSIILEKISGSPTALPSPAPSKQPSSYIESSSSADTLIPTSNPSIMPSPIPSMIPTLILTSAPSQGKVAPSNVPTRLPSAKPIEYPTQQPTVLPTSPPAAIPTSISPTRNPTADPTTKSPTTFAPTLLPAVVQVLRGSSSNGSSSGAMIILSVAIVIVVIFILLLFAAILYIQRRRKLRKQQSRLDIDSAQSLATVHMPKSSMNKFIESKEDYPSAVEDNEQRKIEAIAQGESDVKVLVVDIIEEESEDESQGENDTEDQEEIDFGIQKCDITEDDNLDAISETETHDNEMNTLDNFHPVSSSFMHRVP